MYGVLGEAGSLVVRVVGVAPGEGVVSCSGAVGRGDKLSSATKTFRHGEPTLFRELLHRIAKSTALYLEAQIAAGAAAVQLFDTWSGELNLRDYLDFALPATQEIVSSLDRRAPVIYYTKASNHLLLAAADTGADVLSVDWRADLRDLRHALGPRVALQGNVDPAVLFAPPDAIRRVTHEALAALGGVGHILNLGHGILPQTPVENARLFIETGQQASFAEAKPVVARSV